MAVRKLDRSIAGVGELFWRCGGLFRLERCHQQFMLISSTRSIIGIPQSPMILLDSRPQLLFSLDSSKSLTPFLHKSLRRPEHQVVPPGSQITEQLA